MTNPTGVLFYDPRAKPLSSNGTFMSGCTATFYLTGTTTLTPIYSDGALTPGTALANPLSSDASGTFPAIYLDPSVIYRVILKTIAGVTVSDTDPYVPVPVLGLTQATVGAALYPATAAEITAAVTLVNKSCPPGLVERYGTNTTPGTTDMHAAIVAAYAQAAQAGGATVNYLGTTYNVGSSFTIPNNCVTRGAGIGKTIIQRGFTGDLVTSLGANAALYDLTIDGVTATWGAGRGVLVPANISGQFLCNVGITNFVQHCLEFAPVGGSNFTMVGGFCFTTAALGVGAAIGLSTGGTDGQAVPRTFVGVESLGCTLYDFGGCVDQFIYGGFTNGLIFSRNDSAIISVNGLRIGAAGGTVTFHGISHRFSNCNFASPSVVLAADTTDIDLGDSAVPNYAITDNGTGNRFMVSSSASFTCAWTASGTAPTIGNGSLAADFRRKGAVNFVNISLTIGSTTTLGTGQWFFSLPYLDYTFGRYLGTCLVNHAGTFYTGIAQVVVTQQKVSAFFNASSTPLSPAQPVAFAAGDVVQISIEYSSL